MEKSKLQNYNQEDEILFGVLFLSASEVSHKIVRFLINNLMHTEIIMLIRGIITYGKL